MRNPPSSTSASASKCEYAAGVRIDVSVVCRGRDRQRVAVEGADLDDLVLIDGIHDIRAAADRAARQAPTDRLGQRNQVGRDPEPFGGAPGRDGHPGLDFIEDEECAVLVGEVAHAGQVAIFRQHDPDVHHHRLDDDRRDLATMLVQGAGQNLEVVEGNHGRQVDHG